MNAFMQMVGIVGAYFLVPAYSSLWEYMTITLTFTQYWSFWMFLILLLQKILIQPEVIQYEYAHE